MKRNTEYRSNLTALGFAVPAFLIVIVAGSNGPVFGIAALVVVIIAAASAGTKVRENSGEALAESDKLAQTWDETRPKDEKTVHVRVDLPSGGSVVSTYTHED